MSDPKTEALEFAAEQLSSEWPERCQEIVRRARAALTVDSEDVTAAWVPFSRRLEIAESVGMVVDARFNSIVRAVADYVVNKSDAAPLTAGDERRHVICLCPDCTASKRGGEHA